MSADSDLLLLPDAGLRLSEPDPQKYYLKENQPLYHAVWSALTLGRPLLLTGEPGTGKTELAYWLAWRLAHGPRGVASLGTETVAQRRSHLLRFDTKSTSEAGHLFYTYDVMSRFRDQQFEKTREYAQDILHYLALGPLGMAITRSITNPDATQAGRVSTEMSSQTSGLSVPSAFDALFKHPKAVLEGYIPGARPVVLVDEIDKAPRDFPNDILREIDNLEFRIPEIDQSFHADPARPPVVVMTSNSERDLPEAFLRRCVYHHIEFPTEIDVIEELVSRRLPEVENMFVKDAARRFLQLRQQAGMLKKPATAEFLDWLLVLQKAFPNHPAPSLLLETSGPQGEEACRKTIGTLAKTLDDQHTLEDAIHRLWKTPPPPKVAAPENESKAET